MGRMTMLLTLLLAVCAQDVLPGTKPEPRKKGWLKRHEGFVDIARSGKVDLLFLGDSITDAWRKVGKKIYDEEFAPLAAANFGISGDCTQHLLWRLQNGELEGIRPKAAMVMIGTNNIGWNKQTVESTIAGIRAVVSELRSRVPETKILLLGVFPRGEKPDHPHRAQIKEINAAIAGLDDGGRTVRYLDIGARFLEPDGTLSKRIMPDFLHLTPEGYRRWADAVKAPLAELMGGKGGGVKGVRHVVIFKFKDGTPAEQIDTIVKGFRALKDKIPGILDFEWGENSSPEGLNQEFTHCFNVTFKDAAARDAYLPHPEHRAFVDILKPHLEKVFVVDYQVRD